MIIRYAPATQDLVLKARDYAVRRKSSAIDVEHLVLALLHQEKGILPGLSAIAVEADIPIVEAATPTAVPQFTNRAKTILAHAEQVADLLNDPNIRPEHVLLALFWRTDSPVVQILQKHGVTRERVLEQIGLTHASIPATAPERMMRFRSFLDDVKRPGG